MYKDKNILVCLFVCLFVFSFNICGMYSFRSEHLYGALLINTNNICFCEIFLMNTYGNNLSFMEKKKY